MKKLLIFTIFVAVVISPQTISAQVRISPTQTPQQLTKTQVGSANKDKEGALEPTKAALQEKLEEFKQRIAQIKDEKRKAIVERIVGKIPSANTRLTNKMGEGLNKLRQILNKIKGEAANLATAGENTTALYTAITAAESAIQDAQAAVDTQAIKEYSADITSGAALRGSVGQMVSQFRLDIQAVHKLVVEAKQAVAKAIAELAKLRAVGNLRATDAGTLIP